MNLRFWRGRDSVLYFLRSRARADDQLDLSIAEELRKCLGGSNARFVLCAPGAAILKAAGWPVIEQGFCESADFLQAMIAAARIISSVRPAVVVSHEQFSALPAARIAGVPAIFVNDWFPASGSPAGDCLAHAESIIFTENRGIFPVPLAVKVQPIYVGPVVRKMRYQLPDRSRARSELGLADKGVVVSVIPGAWATEEKAPLLDLALPSFDAAGLGVDRTLVWVAGADHETVRSRSAGYPVVVFGHCSPIERLMVASDLVLTKGDRQTTLELASLGVPSISTSYAVNPIDDLLVPRIRSNAALHAKAIDSAVLSRCISEAVFAPSNRREPLGLHKCSAEAAAEAVAAEVRRLAIR